MIYFASDFHLGHQLMLKTRKKEDKQFVDISDYNEYLISKFNERVKDGDVTYFLGDFSWDDPGKYLDRLNGEFIFIRGNHDRDRIEHKKITKWYDGYYDGRFSVNGESQKITLCHYPMRSWNCSHHGAWQMYGHHHSKTDFGGKTLNCSIDSIGYTPISLTRVGEYMSKREDNWDLIKK